MALIAVLAAGVALWLLLSKPGQVAPVYQGRTAEQWLGQVFTTNQTAALATFQQMGLEVMPVLVRAFEKSDSRWDKFYQWAYPKLPSLVRVRLSSPVPARVTWSAASLVLLNHRAYRSEPGKVLPDLLRLLEDKNNQAHAYIIGPVIGVVGPNSTNCLPALIRCLQATDPGVRREAAVGLEQIGPSAKAAVPDLTAVLKDPDMEVRILAARALWKIDRQTNFVAPVLEEALKTLRPGDLQNMTAVFLSEVNPDSPVLLPANGRINAPNENQHECATIVRIRFFGGSFVARVARVDHSEQSLTPAFIRL
jgi:hypothetical protein